MPAFIFCQGTLLFVKQCTSCFDLQELRYFKKKVAMTCPFLTSRNSMYVSSKLWTDLKNILRLVKANVLQNYGNYNKMAKL